MITAQWFNKHVSNRQDLSNQQIMNQITAEEYKALKGHVKEFLQNEQRAMYYWNKNVAMKLIDTYEQTIKVMTEIEQEVTE